MPTITFNTIQELITYVDQFIKVNHNNEITGEQHNNVENGLASFIISSPRNYDKAYVTGTAAAFVAVASQCVLIFTAGGTGSIQLLDNKWNEWVIYNNSGANKALVGSITNYITQTGVTRNYIPTGAVVCLAKAENNLWYEIDNGIGGATVSGTAAISITSDDFESDGVTYLNPLLVSDNVNVYWSDLANYIYESKGQWEYVTGGGIKILLAGFDANSNDYYLELSLKEINL